MHACRCKWGEKVFVSVASAAVKMRNVFVFAVTSVHPIGLGR